MKKLLGMTALIVCSFVSYAQIDSSHYLIPLEQRKAYENDSILILVISTTGKMEICGVDSSYAKDKLGIVDTMRIGNKPNSNKPEYMIVGKKTFSDRYIQYVAFPKGYRHTKNSPMVQGTPLRDKQKGVYVLTWVLWEKMDVYIYTASNSEFYHYVTYFPFDFLPDANDDNDKYEQLIKKLHHTKQKESYTILVKDNLGRVREKIEDVHFLM